MWEKSKQFEKHIKKHMSYPATKKAIVAACGNMSDVSPKEKKWFADALPEKTYKSADEVLKAVAAVESKSW